MKNRKHKFLAFCLLASILIPASGCKSNSKGNYENYATVIYNLEGGSYQGSSEAVKIYYNVSEGNTQSIGKTLEDIDKSTITPYGTDLEFGGWYYKDENGNKIDFNSNYKISYKESLNVYADWKSKVTLTWEFKAKIKNSEVTLASYNFAKAGDALSVDSSRLNTLKEALLEKNCTFDGTFEYNGKKYSQTELSSIVMPDSKSDHTETIYVDYIEGRYKMVSTLSELNSAIKSDFIYNSDDLNNIVYYDGIYLAADIESKSLIKFQNLNGSKTHRIKIVGNNHTIKYSYSTSSTEGVKTQVDGTRYNVGTIFNEMDYIDIENLNFDVTCTANVQSNIIVGFALKVNNSTINNVNVNFNYKVSGKGSTDLIIPDRENYNGIYFIDESSNNTITNLNTTLIKK